MGLFSRKRAGAGRLAGQDGGELGYALVALRLEHLAEAPPACMLVVFSENGQARRIAAERAVVAPGKKMHGPGERAYCFHPGPYNVDLTPFAAAPELGLRTRFVIDAADPRVAQQRFDLYLFSEAGDVLSVTALGAAIEVALQNALEQGTLDLPPCTSIDEWNAFRAGFNQLLYTRFGVTVDDCVPVDLGDKVDYATTLRTRAATAPAEIAVAEAAPSISEAESPSVRQPPSPPKSDAAGLLSSQPPSSHADQPPHRDVSMSSPRRRGPIPHHSSDTAENSPGSAAPLQADHRTHHDVSVSSPRRRGPHHPSDKVENSPGAAGPTPCPPNNAAAPMPTAPKQSPATADAHALRRLFLELPALAGGLRLIALSPGHEIFIAHRSLLQRVALLSLDVGTMPSLAWAAPDRPLALNQQTRRAQHSVTAVQALDQAWALLARLQLPAAAPQPELAALLDEADRIISNLDHHLAQRRTADVPASPQHQGDTRREPSL